MRRREARELQGKPAFEQLEERLLLSGTDTAIELFNISPALFVENQGQWADSSLRYIHNGNNANVGMTDSGPIFQVFRSETSNANLPESSPQDYLTSDDIAVQMLEFSATFVDANSVVPIGLDPSAAKFNYFIGDQANWQSDMSSYEMIGYEQLYDGVDLYTWGQRDSLKYEFRVAPGANYQQITISYEGIEGLSLNEDGSLLVNLGGDWGELIDEAPHIYQEIDGERIEVVGTFELLDANTYAFNITGAYDSAVELIIDPDLAWSSYLGGSGTDYGLGVAVDAAGNVLVTGSTYSSGWVSGGFDTSRNGSYDAFVAKLSPSGGHLWSSYLGGSGTDYGLGVAVDAAGNVLVTGDTYSSGWVSGGFDTSFDGDRDAFVAKLSPSGGHLWSSFLGGSGSDLGYGVAVDASGNALVTGSTYSSDFSGANNAYHGANDAFVAKVSSSGSLLWSSFLGGSSTDNGCGVAVDAAGNVLVTGNTGSSGWVSGGFDTSYNGGYDAFVAKLSPSGGHLWSSYLGGSGYEQGQDIAVDAAGNVLVTGYINSPGWGVSGGFDTSYNGGSYDAFVAKLSPSGGHLWSSYLGGSSYDIAEGVAVDAAGNVLVTGYTASSGWVSGGFDTSYNGGYDAFVAKLSPSGGHLWSTYLGGSGFDYGHGVAVDAAGNVLVTGDTYSSGWVSGGFDTSYNGGYDAFVAKLSPGPVGPVNTPPTIEIDEPTTDIIVLRGETVGITWTAEDTDDDATISIYLDSDTTPGGGTLLASNISENDHPEYWDDWDWNEVTVQTGSDHSYYIYVEISDGTETAWDYSGGKLTILDSMDQDSDYDGVPDIYEIATGTDPNDPTSWFSNGLTVFGKNAFGPGFWDPAAVVGPETVDLLGDVYNDLDGQLNHVKFWLIWGQTKPNNLAYVNPGTELYGVEPYALPLSEEQLDPQRNAEYDELVDEYAFPEMDHASFSLKPFLYWDEYDEFLQEIRGLGLAALPWIGEGGAAPENPATGEKLNPDDSWDAYLDRLYLHVRGVVRRYGRRQWDSERKSWRGMDLIHFWNMENELNWTWMWRTLNPNPEWAWMNEDFATEVLKTISDAIKAEDPLAIRTHNFNTGPLVLTHTQLDDLVETIAEGLNLSVPGLKLSVPTWTKGWELVGKWADYVDVIGLGSYDPQYIISSPAAGGAVAPLVTLAAYLTGKPAMVVESGYPTGPALLGYDTWQQAEWISRAIPASQLASEVQIAGSSQKSGLGFTYFALNTSELPGTTANILQWPVEYYWGLVDLAGQYKPGFWAYKAALSGTELVDSTWQALTDGWAAIYSSLGTVQQGATAVVDFVVETGREMQNLLVNWPGSTFAVSLYNPDGDLCGGWESSDPPIVIDLGNALVGTWTVEVTAVDVPYDDYPFMVILETPLELACTVDVKPDTLNLKAKGKYVTVNVVLPDITHLLPENIGWATLQPVKDPSKAILAEKWSVEYENGPDGPVIVTFKFNAAEVRSWYADEHEAAAIVLRGALMDGTQFEGSDTIWVISPGNGVSAGPLALAGREQKSGAVDTFSLPRIGQQSVVGETTAPADNVIVSMIEMTAAQGTFLLPETSRTDMSSETDNSVRTTWIPIDYRSADNGTKRLDDDLLEILDPLQLDLPLGI